jgi:GGDEF domain-containing protein
MTSKKLPANEVTLNSQLKRGLKAVNKELAFEIQEKGKRAAELVIANKELDYQSHEKADRAAELVIANKELGFQVQEKAKRAAELVISDLHMAKLSAELNCANNELSTLKTENSLRLEHGQAEPETYSRFILENNPAAIRITSKETGKVLFANQSFCELIDEPLELALGIDPKKFYANVEDFEYIISCLRKGENVSNRLVKLINGKGIKWALGSYSNTEFEGIPAYVAWIYDISNLKHMEDEASRMAYYDVLTGLPNRRLLIDRLGQALAKEKRSGHYQALLFLDLDRRFKHEVQHGLRTA